MSQKNKEYFMRVALAEAKLSLEEGNIPIGAVITYNEEIISQAHNQVQTKHSDLAHAELGAILTVQEFLYKNKEKCDIYTTLEPCLMCFGAIIHFKFRRIVIGALDVSVGALGIAENSRYYRERMPEIVTNYQWEQSRELLKTYVERTGTNLHLLS